MCRTVRADRFRLYPKPCTFRDQVTTVSAAGRDRLGPSQRCGTTVSIRHTRAEVSMASESLSVALTSGAPVRKQLVPGVSGTCKLVPIEGTASLPQGLSFSAAGELSGAAGVVSSAVTGQYRLEISDGNGQVTSKFIRITINPPLEVRCAPVAMTAGGRITVSQLPCQARGGTGQTIVSYIGPDGALLEELPGGLKIDEKGGLFGTVPNSSEALKGIEIQFADAGGAAVRAPISLDIRPPISMDVENIQFRASEQPQRPIDPPRPVARTSGGSGEITVKMLSADGKQPAQLPEGLRFNEITKQLEGYIPTAKDVGEKQYLLRAVDQGGGSIERVLVLKINPPFQPR
ncbi:putative Ig domain-containing protein [Streptomyces klenkii]